MLRDSDLQSGWRVFRAIGVSAPAQSTCLARQATSAPGKCSSPGGQPLRPPLQMGAASARPPTYPWRPRFLYLQSGLCAHPSSLYCNVNQETFSSVQFSSVAQSCPILCDPMNRSTPGLPVHHQRPKFTQTHVHRVGDAIQPSHPLSSPSPPAPNPSQHHSLFQ